MKVDLDHERNDPISPIEKPFGNSPSFYIDRNAAMSGNSFEEGWVDTIATSLEEQLSTVYPQGPNGFDHSNDANGNDGEDDVYESKIEVVLRNCSLNMNMNSDFAYMEDQEILQKAFARAVGEWKSKNASSVVGEETTAGGRQLSIGSGKTSNSTANSFSLFDQLQGGFALPVSLEEIQEASTAQERLEVFRKVKYLEDLLMDWNEICPLLNKDLSESVRSDRKLALEIIALQRKWFDQGRSSPEYGPVLYGICQNLIETLAEVARFEDPQRDGRDPLESNERTLIAALALNWREMWLDLMQRDQYSEVLATEIEHLMVSIFLKDDSSARSRLARKAVDRADPCARWFEGWVRNLRTDDRLVSLLCGPTPEKAVLPDLWARVRGDDPCTPASVLSAVLCRTRLSEFPWGSLAAPGAAPQSHGEGAARWDVPATAVDEMLDSFLLVVVRLSLGDESTSGGGPGDEPKTVVLNGVEAILAGSYDCRDGSDYDRRRGKITSVLRQDENVRGDEAVARFLERQLDQR